jgi:uracil-DNA glycosylase
MQEQAFQQLVERVQACRICSRMEGRTRVLGLANGNTQAQVLFVAEAPGRLGADHWGIPLFADQTGRNFETLLRAAHFERSSVFITNAVLCNPRDQHGRNATPTARELHNCSAHLRATIEIIQPRYVVALGRIALQALKTIAFHEAVLMRDVGHPLRWNGRWLIPLYHPSPRACIHRPLHLQLEDYRLLGDFVRGKEQDIIEG